jgi:hypothetical protein
MRAMQNYSVNVFADWRRVLCRCVACRDALVAAKLDFLLESVYSDAQLSEVPCEPTLEQLITETPGMTAHERVSARARVCVLSLIGIT